MSDAGYSEETCVRCGWTMGQPALNCQNDNTPHWFPSSDARLAAYDAARATVKIEGNTRAYYVLRAENAESRLAAATEALNAVVTLEGSAWLDRLPTDVRQKVRAALHPDGAVRVRVTHGRHCPCSACEREDWTRITSPCGMHGEGCPAVYAPIHPDGAGGCAPGCRADAGAGLHKPECRHPDGAVFHHDGCGASWTLPNVTTKAVCPNCGVWVPADGAA